MSALSRSARFGVVVLVAGADAAAGMLRASMCTTVSRRSCTGALCRYGAARAELSTVIRSGQPAPVARRAYALPLGCVGMGLMPELDYLIYS